jgi:hypothetical protein
LSAVSLHKLDKSKQSSETLAWLALQQHPLMTVLKVPNSGGGILFCLKELAHCLQGVECSQDWHQEVVALIAAIEPLGLANAEMATSHDKAIGFWGALYKLLMIRRETTTNDRLTPDRALGYSWLHHAAMNKPMPQSLIYEFSCLYARINQAKPCMQHMEWSAVLAAMRSNSSALVEIAHDAKRGSIQALLCKRLIPHMWKSVTPIKEAKRVRTLLSSVAAQTFTNESTLTLGEMPNHQEVIAETKRQRFAWGDSVGKYIRSQSEYLTRSQRLGLGSPRTVPHEQIAVIAKNLFTQINQPGISTDAAAGQILGLLQLSLPLPFYILIRVPLGCGPDVSLDLDKGCVCLDRGQLISQKESIPTIAEIQAMPKSFGLLRIPIPALIVATLRARKKLGHTFIGDLFLHASMNEEQLKKLHAKALNQAGEKSLTLPPGKWAESIRGVHLHLLSSDMTAAISSLSPGLCSDGAMHYFNPSERLLHSAALRVFQHLDLGEPYSAIEDEFQITQNKIRADEDLIRQGLTNLVKKTQTSLGLLQKAGASNDLFKSYNECAINTCAILLMSVAGRGTKLNNLTWGSLHSSEQLIHIQDKQVRGSSGSRLIAKTNLTKWAIRLHALATHHLAIEMARRKIKLPGFFWNDACNGAFDFGQPAFWIFDLNTSKPNCTKLTAAHIETLTQEHFKQPKNFMRHAIINCWVDDELDANLLRIITGHARTELEMPAITSSYSPKSAMLSAGKCLERVLKKWVPQSLPLANSSHIQFIKISKKELADASIQSQKRIQDQTSAIEFNQWHLLGERVTKALQQTLLLESCPLHPWAHLWLMLVCFDAITDVHDLKAILSNPDFVERSNGWTVKWARVISGEVCTRALQIPTCCTLWLMRQQPHICSMEQTLSSVNEWLTVQALSEPLLAAILEKAASPYSVLLQCVSLHWDLHIPNGLQFCDSLNSNVSHLSQASMNRLLGCVAPKIQHQTIAKHRSKRVHTHEDIDIFIKIISDLGNNSVQHGEMHKRASLYEKLSDANGLPNSTGWAKDLDDVARLNIEMLRNNDKHCIEFSSMRTYLSHLHPHIYENLECPPSDWDEENAFEIAEKFLSLPGKQSHSSSANSIQIRRLKEQRDAAAWLLRSLKALGHYTYVIAHESHKAVLGNREICHFSKSELDLAKLVANRWARNELEQLQLNAAFSLLNSAPTRWMECATLKLDCLCESTGHVSIEPVGFSHLKSFSSRRIIKLNKEAYQAIKHLEQRMESIATTPNSFLFFKNNEQKKVNATPANWINRAIQDGLATATGEDRARVHHLRANVICNIVYPNIYQHFHAWLKNPMLDTSAKTNFFDYDRSNAWRIDEARAMAGHFHPKTTLENYFFIHPIARVLSVHAAIDAKLIKTAIWINEIEEHKNRLRTAASATEETQTIHELNNLKFSKILTPQSIQEDGLKSSTACGYWVARLQGFNKTIASDEWELNSATAQQLERNLKKAPAWMKSIFPKASSIPNRPRSLTDTPVYVQLLKTLDTATSTQLRCLVEVMMGDPKISNWAAQLKTLAGLFFQQGFVLELITKSTHVNLELHAELSSIDGIEIGIPSKSTKRTYQVFVLAPNTRHISTQRRRLQETVIGIACGLILWTQMTNREV